MVSPVRFKVTGILAKGPKSAASLKMDAIDEAYLRNNVEVLVKEGFAKDPNKLIEQAREVARQALDESEGKINPEGNFENELITAVFGQKESAPQIKDARLRELLAAKDSKLQHAYRSYDVDALAGIAPTGKSGIAFDWFNIKNNYSPFDDKLFMPTETFEGSPGSYFRPKSSRDTSAQVRTFKSPVYLKDGSRLSGVADNPEQSPFYGFDKNGQEFSQGREYINPQDITKSRDSDRTANQIRKELESGQKLFMPASEAGAGKGKVAEAAKLWNEKGIDSPYFKKWFGKSKVVDENGEPLVVYHGSKADFTEFKRSKGGEFGSGMYFSDNIDSAKMFGSFQKGDSEVVTNPVYLTLKNPLITNDRNVPRGAGIKSLIKKGYDGVIGTTPNGQKQYIAFSPEQIKSATGNRGTFDAGERNINYMPSDPKAPKAQPANRITRQAPAMPGNRFMAPAASAGAKLSERFR